MSAFVRYASQPLPLADTHVAILEAEASLLFDILEEHGHEFGFRVAQEMVRFFGALRLLVADLDATYAIDAQIYQKILPRLSGSQAQLEPVLITLASFCVTPRDWHGLDSGSPVLKNGAAIADAAQQAAENFDDSVFDGSQPPVYPMSYAKLKRMHRRLQRNGFTSFAEA